MTKKRGKPFDAQALMKLLFLPLTAFAVFLGSCTGGPAPVHVAQQLCSELSDPDEACWIELTDQTGCYVQIPAPHAADGDRAEIRTWTGECVEGLAQGTGTLEWGAIMWKHTGHLQAGKYHGEWEEDHTFGAAVSYYDGSGSYVEGVRHGHWYLYYGKGFPMKAPTWTARGTASGSRWGTIAFHTLVEIGVKAPTWTARSTASGRLRPPGP